MNKPSRRTSTLGLQNQTRFYPEDSNLLTDIAKVHRGNSSESQRNRLLVALKKLGSITTIEARRYLDILSPAPRVMELRKTGVDIETIWVYQPTDSGTVHRIGRYILKAEGGAYGQP